VLLRRPLDAASSLLVRHPELRASIALRWYIAFYKPLITSLSNILVVPFEVVIADFGRVIDAVNTKYATEYESFDHSEEAVRQILAQIRQIEDAEMPSAGAKATRTATPSSDRARALADTRLIVASEQRLLKNANALYEGLNSIALRDERE
jgi:hypothetical protein